MVDLLLGSKELKNWLKKRKMSLEDIKCAFCQENITADTLQFIVDAGADKVEFVCRKSRCVDAHFDGVYAYEDE